MGGKKIGLLYTYCRYIYLFEINQFVTLIHIEGKIIFTDEVEAINKEAEALKEKEVKIIIAVGKLLFKK